MGLLNLTTDLKSLRYGKDRIGGGSSKEPFITKSIDSTPGDTGGPDFLLRANTLQHTADDTSRIFQYLKSPKGLQFAAKQNLLSRSAVRSQASNGPINEGIYLPTSTLAQTTVISAGGHLLKQGINPFADTSTKGANTGIGIIDSILNASLPLSAPFYAKKVTSEQSIKENRLTQLVDYKLGIAKQTSNQSNSFLDSLLSGGVGGFAGGLLNNLLAKSPSAGQKANSISLNKDEILRYDGGPGSLLGVGQTGLKRVTNTQEYEELNDFKGKYYLLNYSDIIGRQSGNWIKGGAVTLPDFRQNLMDSQKAGTPKNILSTSVDYAGRSKLETRVHLGDPGRKNRNLTNYNIGADPSAKTPFAGALDKINALPIYSSNNVVNSLNGLNIKNDFVKFRIGILDNNSISEKKKYIHFRAFIDSFADNYTATWNAEKFMGRGENFYRYGGFGRTISMSWTLAAQSMDELIPMYQKLNFLASSLAPDYSEFNYMQGNIAYLTMGGYCYEQPGIITSLGLSYPEQSPWEIDLDSKEGANDGGVKTKELPMIMKVGSFNFTPIHNFVPRIQQNSFDGQKEGNARFVSAWGKEQYIALRNTKGNNYDGGLPNFTLPYSKTEQSPNNQTNNTATSQGLSK